VASSGLGDDPIKSTWIATTDQLYRPIRWAETGTASADVFTDWLFGSASSAVTGTVSGVVTPVASASASHGVAIEANGSVVTVGLADASHGIAGTGSYELDLDGAATAAHGVSGTASAPVGITGAASGTYGSGGQPTIGVGVGSLTVNAIVYGFVWPAGVRPYTARSHLRHRRRRV
jgi:hypothetical protein